MFWSQLILLQMWPGPFNKRYYGTQNAYGIKTELYLQVKYINMAAHSILYHDTMETQWLFNYKFTKNINAYVL